MKILPLVSEWFKTSSSVPVPSPGRRPRAWIEAQAYELDNAVQFMNQEGFSSVLDTCNDPGKRMSAGYADLLTLKEFFSGEMALWRAFVEHVTGKVVLEIGPCVASQLSLWDVASHRYVIEPLLDSILDYQRATFGRTGFASIQGYAVPAEARVDALVQKVDGALLIRNCLDHSPSWPFIVSNMADYMVKGSYLLLWNDLQHPPGFEDGHYDISNDVGMFRRFLENMGWEIEREYQQEGSPCLNFGCFARKA